MKTCTKCDIEKELTEFNKDSSKRDGLKPGCRSCLKACAAAYNEANKEKIYAANLVYRAKNKEKIKAYRADYGKTEVGKAAASRAASKYQAKNPIKVKAKDVVAYAIKMGRLARLPCETCGEAKVEAHHDDYSKPLDVRFLCIVHHNEWHKLNGSAINGI